MTQPPARKVCLLPTLRGRDLLHASPSTSLPVPRASAAKWDEVQQRPYKEGEGTKVRYSKAARRERRERYKKLGEWVC